MHASKELDLDAEAVRITWCACERCNAVGPRFMTVIRNRHEYTVQLNDHGRGSNAEETLVHDEDLHTAGRPPLRNQLPR
jgi:hypothetical protein